MRLKSVDDTRPRMACIIEADMRAGADLPVYSNVTHCRPYRASIAAGTLFPNPSKRLCSVSEEYGLFITNYGLELVDQFK